MKVIYTTDTGTEHVELFDDSQFVMDQPRGFVRIIEKRPEGMRSWYFNMQHLIAIGPGEGTNA